MVPTRNNDPTEEETRATSRCKGEAGWVDAMPSLLTLGRQRTYHRVENLGCTMFQVLEWQILYAQFSITGVTGNDKWRAVVAA